MKSFRLLVRQYFQQKRNNVARLYRQAKEKVSYHATVRRRYRYQFIDQFDKTVGVVGLTTEKEDISAGDERNGRKIVSITRSLKVRRSIKSTLKRQQLNIYYVVEASVKDPWQKAYWICSECDSTRTEARNPLVLDMNAAFTEVKVRCRDCGYEGKASDSVLADGSLGRYSEADSE